MKGGADLRLWSQPRALVDWACLAFQFALSILVFGVALLAIRQAAGPMSWSEFYTEAKGWQTAIGSALGFVALVVGALFNYWLGRCRDKRLRDDEARAIEIVLYWEIVKLRRETARLSRLVSAITMNGRRNKSGISKEFMERNVLPDAHIYTSLAQKIESLEPELVSAITEFYGNYNKSKDAFGLLVESPDRGFQYAETVFLEPALDCVCKIVPALRAIEARSNISPPAADPDLGMTEEAIRHWNDIFEEQLIVMDDLSERDA